MDLLQQRNLSQDASFQKRCEAAVVTAAISISSEASNEVQTLTFGGTTTGGTYTLTCQGQTTAAIQWNASAGAVHAALGALTNVGINNMAVTGGPGPGTPLVVTFIGTLSGSPQTLITVASSLTGTSPTLTPTRTTAGAVGAVNHAQRAALASKVVNNPVGYGQLFAPGVASQSTVQADFDPVALVPRNGAITNATNASPIVVTSANHGLTTGQTVTITGVIGNTAANTTQVVTVVDVNTFSIPVAGNGAYTSGGSWVVPESAIKTDVSNAVSAIFNAYT